MKNQNEVSNVLDFSEPFDSTQTPVLIAKNSINNQSASGKFINFHYDSITKVFYVYMSKCMHVCLNFQSLHKIEFGITTCKSAWYFNGSHYLSLSDQSLKVLKFTLGSQIKYEEKVLRNKHSIGGYLIVEHNKQMYYSPENNQIFKGIPPETHTPTLIYFTDLGEIVHFAFIKSKARETYILVCALKLYSTGLLTIEIACRANDTEQYIIERRYTLEGTTDSIPLFAELGTRNVICVTKEFVWKLSENKQLHKWKSSGLQGINLLHQIDVTKRRNDKEYDIRVYSNDGNILQTVFHKKLERNHVFKFGNGKYNFTKCLKSGKIESVHKLNELEFILITKHNELIKYNIRGSIGEQINGLKYQSLTYFDAQRIGNMGTEFDSMLLCGSESSKLGFLEKKVVGSSYLLSKTGTFPAPPLISNFWITRDDIIFESLDTYNRLDGSTIATSNEVLAVCYNGNIIENCNSDIIHFSKVTSTTPTNELYLVLLSTGAIQVRSYETLEYKIIFEMIFLRKGQWFDSIASGAYVGNKLYISIADGNEIFLFENGKQISFSTLNFDFQVSNILVKGFENKDLGIPIVRIAASNYKGSIQVYSDTLNELLFEKRSNGNHTYSIMEMGGNFSEIIFYDNSEVFSLDMLTLGCGLLHLSIPSKLIKFSKFNSMLYILDQNMTLNQYNISRDKLRSGLNFTMLSCFYVFHNYIPIKIISTYNIRYSILITENQKNKITKLSLFDVLDMKMIHELNIGAQEDNIILLPLWFTSHEMYDNFPNPYERFFVLYMMRDGKPSLNILIIDNNDKLKIIEHTKLKHNVSSIIICLEDQKIICLGEYAIDISFSITNNSTCTLSVPDTQDIALFSGSIVHGLKLGQNIFVINTLGKCSTLKINNISIPRDNMAEMELLENKLKYIVSITSKVVYRELSEEDYLLGKKVYQENGVNLRGSYSLLDTDCHDVGRYYHVAFDLSNEISIWCSDGQNIQENIGMKATLKSEQSIVNVTPINGACQNIQSPFFMNSKRISGIIPLFFICCVDSTVLVLSEVKNECWIENISNNIKNLKIHNSATSPDSNSSDAGFHLIDLRFFE